jgi:ketosteroid isomerase-like protein
MKCDKGVSRWPRQAAIFAVGAICLGVAPAANADDLADVRATVAMEGKLFDTRNATLAARVYAPDVIWQNPFGVRFHSEAELERFLTRLFKRPGYLAGHTTSKPAFTDVTLLDATSATAWEEDVSEGQIDDSTGKPIGVRKSHVLYVLQKRHGAWLIVDEMIMDEHVR